MIGVAGLAILLVIVIILVNSYKHQLAERKHLAALKFQLKQAEAERLAEQTLTAEERRLAEITRNRVGMEFVIIPSGSFQMGSPSGESGRDIDEGSQHRVTLRSFYMMTTEVTQKMWKAVMGDNPSNWKGDNLPVENVSWNDIQGFLRKLNDRYPGHNYRLPTEAEWEYACRAGTTTRFYSGNRDSDLSGVCWYKGNSGSKTHTVGQKRANSWGLYDMHGNVSEWCQDQDCYWSSSGPVQNSPGRSYRVLRGGCWYNTTGPCRSASRYRLPPGNSDDLYGFRVVYDD
ncbi:formylglycine-generating enzyme family protein [bacterium]|nr:formylglycine-generating enzyme family protein [bacterium]